MAAVVGCSVVSSRTNTVENQLFHGLRSRMKGFNLSSLATARTRTSPSSLKEASLAYGFDRPELKKVLTEGDARSSLVLEDEVITPLNFQDYLERYRDFTENVDDPPRWFTPLECGAPCKSCSKFQPKWWAAKKVQCVKP
ncbi:hypothetical protein AMTRI_Chr10g225750 [Amborella trichopoda]|uniref:Uncharacterized protein n=1 Tax=Amborella trichopoda TaxID=13333 RepID=W1PFW1_AMBTC|nr:hypothetical protein AMTR_s00058p00097860 [Amborella trichopoda]